MSKDRDNILGLIQAQNEKRMEKGLLYILFHIVSPGVKMKQPEFFALLREMDHDGLVTIGWDGHVAITPKGRTLVKV